MCTCTCAYSTSFFFLPHLIPIFTHSYTCTHRSTHVWIHTWIFIVLQIYLLWDVSSKVLSLSALQSPSTDIFRPAQFFFLSLIISILIIETLRHMYTNPCILLVQLVLCCSFSSAKSIRSISSVQHQSRNLVNLRTPGSQYIQGLTDFKLLKTQVIGLLG